MVSKRGKILQEHFSETQNYAEVVWQIKKQRCEKLLALNVDCWCRSVQIPRSIYVRNEKENTCKGRGQLLKKYNNPAGKTTSTEWETNESMKRGSPKTTWTSEIQNTMIYNKRFTSKWWFHITYYVIKYYIQTISFDMFRLMFAFSVLFLTVHLILFTICFVFPEFYFVFK